MNKALLYILSALALTGSQGCKFAVNTMAFYPDRTTLLSNEQLPPSMQEVLFTTVDGVEIMGLYLPHHDSDRVLIYFHGNAGNIYHRIPDLLELHGFGIGVLGVSYRGYAKSQGRPSESGIYQDGAAAMTYVTDTLNVPLERIILFGRSIGSTVALDVAQGKQIGGVILVTPLSTGREMARNMGLGPVSFLAGDAFNNITKIKQLQAPLLVIHGSRDSVVPYSMGQAIHEAAAVDKHFVTIEGADHNDLSSDFASDYWPPIADFINTAP